jgi:hypothetical protein
VACAASGLAPQKPALVTNPGVPVAMAENAEPSAPLTTADGYELPVRTTGKLQSFPPVPLVPLASDTRLARSSHSQYQHTVQDLLGIRESLALTFAPDALDGFGFDTSNAYRVDARLGPQYRAMAEALAERAVGDPQILARIVPCKAEDPGCRDEFLRSFGERAFRRPLDARDLDTFRALFDSASALSEGADAFSEGVRLTLEAMLQAPEFLYRTHSSRKLGADGRVHLDDFEIASRLSYFLYDSMPDEPLFAAARAGQLHTADQVEAAARRMLSEPRVLEKLVAFHDQAWQFGRFARISPDAQTYPNLPKALVWRVRQATALFIRDILQSGGGLEELLTAPYAYVDTGLAPLYGKGSLGAELAPGQFTRVSFDPAQRKGLLMQIGYLAANAYSIRTDPIHRGLFVIRSLLCRDIPDPPPGATTTPPPETDKPIVTTRDEVELVTGQSFCPTCHSEINAPGYAFEGFDAVGQRRTAENGAAVDTSASMVLDGRLVSFDGPTELVDELARSQEAHLCYSRRWLEFAYGRPLAESDRPTLAAISANSLPIADIIVAIVRSPEFLSFAPTPEAPPATASALTAKNAGAAASGAPAPSRTKATNGAAAGGRSP